jgi:signal transduction histidine kinase
MVELLDEIPSPIFVLEPNEDGNPVYTAFNKAALAVSQIEPEDFMGRTALQVYHGVYGQRAFEQHQKTFRSLQPSVYELTLPLNGTLRFVRTRLEPKLDKNNKLIYMIGSSVDISAERELQEIRTHTHAIEQELQDFIYLAAHDLRSPMQRIHALAEMLRNCSESADLKHHEVIDRLEAVATQSITLVEDVLEHAEITGIEESISDFSLAEMCADTLKMLDPTKSHECNVDDVRLYGDFTVSKIVMRNLIDNAIKHNPQANLTMNISAQDFKAGFFSVTVADDGKAITEPEKLFSSNTTPRRKGGFGLMAIRRLIKLRGGEIYAEHRSDGNGLAVTFALPGKILSATHDWPTAVAAAQ